MQRPPGPRTLLQKGVPFILLFLRRPCIFFPLAPKFTERVSFDRAATRVRVGTSRDCSGRHGRLTHSCLAALRVTVLPRRTRRRDRIEMNTLARRTAHLAPRTAQWSRADTPASAGENHRSGWRMVPLMARQRGAAKDKVIHDVWDRKCRHIRGTAPPHPR